MSVNNPWRDCGNGQIIHGLGRPQHTPEEEAAQFLITMPGSGYSDSREAGAAHKDRSGGRLECRKLAEGLEQHRCLPVWGEACPESQLGFLTMADAS